MQLRAARRSRRAVRSAQREEMALSLALAAWLAGTARASFVEVPPPTAAAVDTGPYYLLKPERFATPLGDDLEWARQNIPLFESANATLDLVYYFRWRTYKSHIHPTNCSAVGGFAPVPSRCKNRTDGIDFVVTEFSPPVSWAGEYNTINCAAGHHMLEGGWLRQPVYSASIPRPLRPPRPPLCMISVSGVQLTPR